ncbi:MAG: PLDc N-terminal domain-containing protein [Rhodopirellula sp.]|nr:PLDc N-terminal domain-containing protein [Rhodopirellula sp.]
MFSLLFALLIAVLDFFALVDVLFSRRPFVEKVLWAVVIVVLPFLGLVLYLMMGRSSRGSDSMI